jgi:DNA-binding beta-propeller fold protein YncE
MRIQTVSILALTCALYGQMQPGELRRMADRAPALPLSKVELKLEAPSAGWKIGYPSSVAMDQHGVIYVLQRDDTADPVIAVDHTGHVLRSWGKGLFKIPHAVRIDKDGNVWTVDAGNSMVYKFSPAGEKLMEISIGEQPEKKRGFSGATDIAFAPNGHLFISDGYGNSRVLEYSADGKRLRQWGSPGNGPGQFKQPHGVAIDDRNIIYVADRQNGRLQRFDMTGRYLGEWSNLGMVTTVAFRDGNLWIGTQEMSEPTSADGWLMKIDRDTGAILGRIESAHGHHVLNVNASGELLSGARPDQVLWFRRNPAR